MFFFTDLESELPAMPSIDPVCPAPEPFIRNMNSSVAILRSDGFNGTQPEHAGNYTCFLNGLPRATIEITVLGKLYISTT